MVGFPALAAVFLVVRGDHHPRASCAAVTLAEYTAKTLTLSPEVARTEAGLAQARARWLSDLAGAWLPSVSANAQLTPYGHDPADSYRFHGWQATSDQISYSASLSWNLFNSFHDSLELKASGAEREAAERALAAARRDQELKAAQAFYELSLKRKLLSVQKSNLQIHEERLSQTQDLYRHGLKSLSDFLKSQTDHASSRLTLFQSEADAHNALARFNLLIQEPPSREAEPEEPGSPPAEPPKLPDLAEALRAAWETRPEIAQAGAQLRRSQALERLRLADVLPTVSLVGRWNWQNLASFGLPSSSFGIPNPNYQVGVAVSLPAGFNLFSPWQRYRAAQAFSRDALENLEAQKRKVREEATQAYFELERASKAFGVADQKAKIAKQNAELVWERYKQGAADVLYLAQSQQDFLQAEVDKAQALRAYALGRLEFNHALGLEFP